MTGPAIAAVLAALLVLGGTATAAQLTSNGQLVDFVRWEPVTPTFRYDALLPDPTRRDGIDGGGLDAVEPATRLHLHVRADGTLEETALRTRMTLRGAAAAGPATLGFEVSAGTETATITEAYTLSPAGDRQPVDPAAIEVHPRPGNRLFSDVSEVVVPFPGTAGDGAIAVLVTRTVVRAGGVQVPWSRV